MALIKKTDNHLCWYKTSIDGCPTDIKEHSSTKLYNIYTKTSANAKTSIKGGGKTNLRTFSTLKSNHRFFPYDIFTELKWPL